MLRNYLKTAIRSFIRNKLYTFINVFGLTLGLTSCFFILIYVFNENSFDTFHEDKEKVFRVLRMFEDEKGLHEVGVTSAPYAEALITDFPAQIDQSLRVIVTDALVTLDERSFMEDRILLADSNFLEFFSYPLVMGDRKTALLGENSLIISTEIARKYFGDEDPLGKIIQFDNSYLFEVKGVFNENHGNSHLDFDMVGSINLMRQFPFFSDWWSNGPLTYIKLKDPADYPSKDEFRNFMKKYFDASNWESRDMYLKLENITEVYFNDVVQFDKANHGDKKAVNTFFIIAIFVCLIAVVNFINLSTATSVNRRIEIGIRKTSGASKNSLIFQFLTESFMVVTVAAILSMFLVEITLPYFNNFLGKEMQIPFDTPSMVLILVIFIISIGTLSGIYPALILSSIKPAMVFKKMSSKSGHGFLLRKGLVIFQFCISISLILATIISTQQLDFLTNKKLGFRKDNILLVRISNDDIRQKRQLFKDRVKQIPGVENMTLISGEPGGFHDRYSFNVEGYEEMIIMRTVFTDPDYFNTFNLEIVNGRFFSEEFSTDLSDAIVINEEAVKFLGWDIQSAIGKEIENRFRDTIPRKVIGVIRDFHFKSLREKIEPLVVSLNPDHRAAAIHLNTNDPQAVIKGVNQVWDELVNKYPFNYSFLDQEYNEIYNSEIKQGDLFQLFAVIAILIACLGLFGLATLSIQHRLKEVGIRKVLGAEISKLFILLSKDFIVLVLIAALIVTPLGWYIMQGWLDNFEYKISLGIMHFIIAAFIALAIAIITVSYHAIKASRLNPVDTLKYE